MSKRNSSSLFQSTKKKPKKDLSVAAVLAEVGCKFPLVLRRLSPGNIADVLNLLALDHADYAALACISKSWFMFLYHTSCNGWTELTSRSLGYKDKKIRDKDTDEVTTKRVYFKRKYAYVSAYVKKKYGGERFPQSLLFYLNHYGIMYCANCAMYSESAGKDNIPISVFEQIFTEKKGKPHIEYRCVNPECKKPLKQKVCSYRLSLVFAACLHSSRSDPKTHNFEEMANELLMPAKDDEEEGQALDRYLNYCTRCGLLAAAEGDVDEDEDIDCEVCLQKNCVCDPCELCGLHPAECLCTVCDECDKCSAAACEICTKKCECDFCDDCDLPAGECECEEVLEF